MMWACPPSRDVHEACVEWSALADGRGADQPPEVTAQDASVVACVGLHLGVRSGNTWPMVALPAFASVQEYVSRLGDVDYWGPYLAEILARHGLTDARQTPVAGFNVSYPTFLYGDVVVKLFGHIRPARRSYLAERAAYAVIGTDPAIAAPKVLGEGRLFDDATGEPWPYLIFSRMPGVATWRAELSDDQMRALAVDLGRQIRQLHALLPTGIATHADWAGVSVTEAATRSSLPPHLAAQAEAYVARLGPFDRVVVHCDITQNHVYVEDGRFVGIIDWGDALVTDRHVELIQIYRDTLCCDKALFQVFLEASGWPVGHDFPYRALAFALHRQAVGLAQHNTIDVFMPIAAKYPLHDIPTLDDLATLLFAL
jgi:hypothetical protein